MVAQQTYEIVPDKSDAAIFELPRYSRATPTEVTRRPSITPARGRYGFSAVASVNLERRTLSLDKIEKALFNWYKVANQEQLHVYLSTRGGLGLMLIEAAQQLRNRFLSAQLELAVVSLPELGTNYQQLFIYVITDLPVEIAFAKLNEFDEEWFLDADFRSGHSFNIQLRWM